MPYLFTYFTREDDGGEQIYFSVSEDGLHWQDLSEEPALKWNQGDGGVRDPYIVQHPVTGEYFIMATDLCIKRRNHQWGEAIARQPGCGVLALEGSDQLVGALGGDAGAGWCGLCLGT